MMSEITNYEDYMKGTKDHQEDEKIFDRDGVPDSTRNLGKSVSEKHDEPAVTESKPTGIDESDPLSDSNIRQVEEMVRQMRQTVEIVQNIWYEDSRQYQLTGEMMYKLHQFNQANITPQDHTKSDEEYDEFNGLDRITKIDLINIFGKNHPHALAAGVDGIMDIIKGNLADYISYVRIWREFKETDRSYCMLIEMRADSDMLKLREVAEAETDEIKKKKLLDSIDQYYSVKFMDYLRDPLSDKDKKAFVDTFGDEKKVEYWINRSKDKLLQMNTSQRFILEISNFEQIHLPERYHMLSNMFLLYFMRSLIFTDVAPNITDPKKKYERDRIFAMINAVDSVIRSTNTTDNINRIKNNIMAFLDQIIDDVYAKYYPDRVIPDILVSNDKKEEN